MVCLKMNRLKKIVVIGLIFVGIFGVTNSFAGDSNSFSTWENLYTDLGIQPTELEFQTEGKRLHMSDSEIAREIVSYNNPEVVAAVKAQMNATDQQMALYLKHANQAKYSRSKKTTKMAEEALSLLDDVNAERDTRNVRKFAITQKKLKALFEVLPDRVDAESNIVNLRNMINKMTVGNAPLAEERIKFSKEIDIYYLKCEYDNFVPMEYVEDMVNRFNIYLHRVNDITRSMSR